MAITLPRSTERMRQPGDFTGADTPHPYPHMPSLVPQSPSKTSIIPRDRNTCASTVPALTMLSRLPVFAVSLPRYHIQPRWVDGTLLVDDRASNEQFKVYTPRFSLQFCGGHRSGLWYLRPSKDLGYAPRSRGFPTACDAITALRCGDWDLTPSPADRLRSRCRIIWS